MPNLIVHKARLQAPWTVVEKRCAVNPTCCDELDQFDWPSQGPGRICQSVPVPIPGNLTMTISGSSGLCNALCDFKFPDTQFSNQGTFAPWARPAGSSYAYQMTRMPLWPNGSYPLRYAGKSTMPYHNDLHLWVLSASVMLDSGVRPVFYIPQGPFWQYSPDQQAPWWYGYGTTGPSLPALPANIFGVRPTLSVGGGVQWRRIGDITYPNPGLTQATGDQVDPILVERLGCPFSVPDGVDEFFGLYSGLYFGEMNPSYVSSFVGQPYPIGMASGFRYGIGDAPSVGSPTGRIYKKYPYKVEYEVCRQMVFGIDTSGGSCSLLMGFYGFIFKVETDLNIQYYQDNGLNTTGFPQNALSQARSLVHAEIFNTYYRSGTDCLQGYAGGSVIETTPNGIYVGPGNGSFPGMPVVEITE